MHRYLYMLLHLFFSFCFIQKFCFSFLLVYFIKELGTVVESPARDAVTVAAEVVPALF
jgi:hypothetical protein